jgi:hypothetical protein
MSEQKFSFPTEVVKLPSKGLVYPKESPLSSGEIEMKYMTAREEDILTNSNYIQKGIVFDKLFQSMIVSKIDYSELIAGDRDAIMLASRILGYGKNYQIKYTHPINGQEEEVEVDLTTLKEKEVDISLFNNINEFTFVLPNTNNEITFKILTQKDETEIEKEIQSLKKINVSNDITSRLKQQILSVNGNRDKKFIRDFIDNGLLAIDSIEFRKYVKKISPGIDFSFNFEGSDGYVEEGVSLPIGISFFYPKF